MLEPRDRRLFLQSLRPPEGYTLDRAIGTTFTLDLLALMAATLEFAMFDWADDDESPTAHPTALLEAVRRHADHTYVFCQAGQIGAPPKNRPLLAHLEGSVVEVRAPRGGLFHPKMWVLRFKPTRESEEPGAIRYRLLVLSRNLTFDRCWDTMVALDGELLNRTRAISANHPIADFVQELPAMAIRELPPGITQSVAMVQEELRRVRFTLPPDIDELTFWPLGLKSGTSWPFKDRIDRLLVISPFVSSDLLTRLSKLSPDNTLISRVDCLAAIEPSVLANFTNVQVINDAAFPEVAEMSATPENGAVPGDVLCSVNDALVGLHAKVFVADAGWDARLWFGSANATDAAFRNNVELLVELTGKKSKCGIDAILGSAESNDSLRGLLQKYEADDVVLPDRIEDGLRSSIETTRQALSNAGLRAAVEREVAGRYVVCLKPSAEQGISLGPEVTVRIWPVTIGEGFSGAPLTSYLAGRTELLGRYEDLAIAELTSFFAVHVVARQDDRQLEERFALNLPLDGAPADRRELLLKCLLKNREALMRYLMFLLAQAGSDALDGGSSSLMSNGAYGADSNGSKSSGIPLLEALLQALHRDPSKLDHIERLVTDLAKTPEGQELLPRGFDQIWEPIMAVRRAATP